MKFRVIETGEILNARQVRNRYRTTFFPQDVSRWGTVILVKLGLEKVEG